MCKRLVEDSNISWNNWTSPAQKRLGSCYRISWTHMMNYWRVSIADTPSCLTHPSSGLYAVARYHARSTCWHPHPKTQRVLCGSPIHIYPLHRLLLIQAGYQDPWIVTRLWMQSQISSSRLVPHIFWKREDNVTVLL